MKHKNIFIVINPASGKNEPILNVINDVFKNYQELSWDIGVTKKFGDAKDISEKVIKARQADLIAIYGGDGTLHEVVNAVVGTKMPIATLPGGTGNGFSAGLGVKRNLTQALKLITKGKTIKVDVIKIDSTYCISRMYTGIEEDMQTSRVKKDKYGMLAYAIPDKERRKPTPVKYHIEIDGKVIKEKAIKCYVANSASSGSGINIGNFSITDGLLDIFTLNNTMESLTEATRRILHSHDDKETKHHWQGKRIKIDAETSQPVWLDGEIYGRTPVDIEVAPKAVEIICA